MSEDLIERLHDRQCQLSKAEAAASMGGAGLAIRVREPETLIADLKEAAAEIERLRAKLAEADSGMLRADFNDCNAERARWKQRAEAAELELTAANKERDNWRQAANHWLDEAMNKRFEKEAAEMRLASAKEVIAPFSDMAKHHAADAPEWRDHHAVHAMVLIGHLRAAAEWMEKGDE